MMCNSCINTSGQKWIKTRMKTPICFNNKGNKVISLCLLNIWSCFLLNNHHHYMCCHCWYLLHHIYASWVNNDDIHQGPKTIFGDKNIHLSLDVAKEKVGDLLLNMCSSLQNNSYYNISKCIVGCYMLILVGALKQMGT